MVVSEPSCSKATEPASSSAPVNEVATAPATRIRPLTRSETVKTTSSGSVSGSVKPRSGAPSTTLLPSVTVAWRSPVTVGGSFAGTTVSVKVADCGADPSSSPSSTAILNEAVVVSEPSCSKATEPASSSTPVKDVATIPATRITPPARSETVKTTSAARVPGSGSAKPRSSTPSTTLLPSATVAWRSPVRVGGSLTGTTVSVKVADCGAEPSASPSSTAILNEAAVVSEPSCSKATSPARSSAPVNEVATAPATRIRPLTRSETVKTTSSGSVSGSVKPRSGAPSTTLLPSVTVAWRSPVTVGGSFAGTTVSVKVADCGADPSSSPSSTAILNEAVVVSEPSCSKATSPARSSAPVNDVATVPATRIWPLTRSETVKTTSSGRLSGSVKPRPGAPSTTLPPSSSVACRSPVSVGASLTASTSISTVSVAVRPPVSVEITVRVSAPLTSAAPW